MEPPSGPENKDKDSEVDMVLVRFLRVVSGSGRNKGSRRVVPESNSHERIPVLRGRRRVYSVFRERYHIYESGGILSIRL